MNSNRIKVVASTNKRISWAAGKVILFGEHAVVYGVPALALGIEKGAKAWTVPAETVQSTLSVKAWSVEVKEGGEESHLLERSFSNLLLCARRQIERRGQRWPGSVVVEVECDLPPGGGLGCSAAVGVAVSKAVDPEATTEEILERVMEWEKVFHGNPSGLDATVSALGGCIYFVRGKPIEYVELVKPLLLCVGDSGQASSTKSMVELVAEKMRSNPDHVNLAWDKVREIVSRGKRALEKGLQKEVGLLMNQNQDILDALFLSTTSIAKMCDLAKQRGALGAKLTGAGGGGSVIALVESERVANSVMNAWRQSGFSCFLTAVRPAEHFVFCGVAP